MKKSNIKRFCNPSVCDCCQSKNIIHTNNATVYGTSQGLWPYIWFCKDCKAYVGCEFNKTNPLGKMANKAERILRKEVRELISKCSSDILKKLSLKQKQNVAAFSKERLEQFKNKIQAALKND